MAIPSLAQRPADGRFSRPLHDGRPARPASGGRAAADHLFRLIPDNVGPRLETARGAVDLRALPIARLLKADLAPREISGSLYVDSPTMLLGIHLLRHHSGAGRSARSPAGDACARRIPGRPDLGVRNSNQKCDQFVLDICIKCYCSKEQGKILKPVCGFVKKSDISGIPGPLNYEIAAPGKKSGICPQNAKRQGKVSMRTAPDRPERLAVR
ncbi:hypothetical protein KXS07_30600 [Inquilinus limosus]|uniref:hypothetical protein n=1 Tax=Inquilinus limosus TaxID=171674 RepID=UPI003F1898CF